MTGASTNEPKSVTVEEVRTAILDHNPTGPEALTTVIITADNGAVGLKGTVPDEDTHANMVNRVKRMPNVKSVRDELTVAPKSGSMQGGALQGGNMQGGNMQGGNMQQGTGSQGGSMQQGSGSQGAGAMGSTKTKNTDAIRAGLMKDKAAPTTIVNGLIISDDGSVIMLSGEVPDDATHDAVLKSAKKSAASGHVQDNLHVTGK